MVGGDVHCQNRSEGKLSVGSIRFVGRPKPDMHLNGRRAVNPTCRDVSENAC
jgi:hypothetical protein